MPAHQEATLSELRISREMWPAVVTVNRDANQNGCVGATLTLGFNASGTLTP